VSKRQQMMAAIAAWLKSRSIPYRVNMQGTAGVVDVVTPEALYAIVEEVGFDALYDAGVRLADYRARRNPGARMIMVVGGTVARFDRLIEDMRGMEYEFILWDDAAQAA
jgi:hypothetical protein